MNSFPDRLNDQLERQRRSAQPTEPFPIPASRTDPDVDELATLAQQLQTVPQLQPDPGFARRLEARILARSSALSRQQARTAPQRKWIFPRPYRISLVLGVALVCLLVVVMAGTFTVAAQGAKPDSPLYGVSRWVQQIQHPQAGSDVAQGNLSWRKAQDQLQSLTTLADPAHTAAYQQALIDLDHQIDTLSRSVQALPVGADRDDLSNKLTTLKGNARQSLRKLLPRLALSEKFQTTEELGRLGDTVPDLEEAVIQVSRPQKQAKVILTGEDLQTGLALLVDNQVVAVHGFSQGQDSNDVVIVPWSDGQAPATLGILNPDGTVAQTTKVTFTVIGGESNTSNNASSNAGGNVNTDNNEKGNNNNNGKGNMNGKGKGNMQQTP